MSSPILAVLQEPCFFTLESVTRPKSNFKNQLFFVLISYSSFMIYLKLISSLVNSILYQIVINVKILRGICLIEFLIRLCNILHVIDVISYLKI